MWLARVYVTLEPTVNDPQGLAIRGGLHHLGFESVESVRAGKYLELRLDQLDEGRAGGRVDAMSRPRLKAP
jgi:phosphoribosylformylglycinamidine synthase PurS subunit